MLTDALLPLFIRDLQRLSDEISSFENEQDLWRTTGTITNSAGNLCLHLCGNLQHFIGATLGGTTYVRDRDNEFQARNIARTTLLQEIEHTRSAIEGTIPNLSEQALQSDFPIKVFAEAMSTTRFLIHLQGHLNYHLGQINYLRRML
jgi:uncharacterized damage-inducible protein DinB